MTLTTITGIWAFNGNGSTGSMKIIFVDAQGNLSVEVTFDRLNRVDQWEGIWHDAEGRITLIRHLPNNVIQNHTGFLGSNDPAHLILAGSFTESDIPDNAQRTQFGWFAQWQSDIIP